MPPLGVGVNIAMLDASDRALALVGNATIDATIYAYEDLMFPRPSEDATMLQGHAADLVRAAMPQFE
ncbi:hypothetical protein [Brevibacterium oceani]|uniref:hypothetical protein n=1 Tax=Brevibacterium oceani TaxID=358099 RepID=UPI0015E68D31|nr:hypothetical protein [Brevibacterium oceani]